MKTEPYEEISVLTSSPNYIKILRLLDEESGRKRDLENRSDMSRSTINRGITRLEEKEWIEEHNIHYEITFVGQLLIRHYDRFESQVKQLSDKKEFFQQLRDENLSIPLEVLEASELTVATERDPHIVINNFRKASNLDVDEFVGMLPVVSPIFNDHAREILERGTDMELIIDLTVLKQSQDKYSEDLELGLNADNFDLLVHPDPLMVGLAAFDNKHALFGAFNDRGQLNAGLTGNNQILIDWVKDLYTQHREDAVPIGEYF